MEKIRIQKSKIMKIQNISLFLRVYTKWKYQLFRFPKRKKNLWGLFKRLYDIKKCEYLKNNDGIFGVFYDFRKNGGRVIDIGLENVAVPAARVVELPTRCSNKTGKKRRNL